MTLYQQITLSLMTLSRGIAFFTVLLRKKRKKANANAHIQVGDDIISQLPDELLLSIMTRLSAKDGRRTSLLSKRWRNLYKLMSHINLSCRDLLLLRDYVFYPYHNDRRCCDIVLERLILIFWRCSGYKIRSLQLRCCITNERRFRACFYPLQHLGVEALYLCFSCCKKPNQLSFPLDHLYLLPSLKLLHLGLCVLKPNLRCQSYSLQTLQLKSVKVFPASLECILSSCLRLHSLSIHECDCPSKLTISGPDLQLKSLIIRYCEGVEEIELHASNLVVLDFKNWEMVNFIFDHVPQLQTLHFNVQSKNPMPRVFGESAQDLPNLKSLTLVTTGDFYQESSRLLRLGVGMFDELRQLELSVCCTPKIDLLSLIPILQSCPLLREFRLDLQNLNYEEGPQMRKSSIYHSELKKVEISGFSGKENEIDFALSILCSTKRLSQMHIIWYPKCYKRCCGWITLARKKWNEETIQQKLQGRAISKNVQLIIDHIHTSNIVRRNINFKIDRVPPFLLCPWGLRDPGIFK